VEGLLEDERLSELLSAVVTIYCSPSKTCWDAKTVSVVRVVHCRDAGTMPGC